MCYKALRIYQRNQRPLLLLLLIFINIIKKELIRKSEGRLIDILFIFDFFKQNDLMIKLNLK